MLLSEERVEDKISEGIFLNIHITLVAAALQSLAPLCCEVSFLHDTYLSEQERNQILQ